MAADSARRSGLWNGSTATAVPSRTFFVRAAMCESTFRLSEIRPWRVKWCSVSQTLWKPSSSTRTASRIASL